MGQSDPPKCALTSPALTMTALAAAMANDNASIPLFKNRGSQKTERGEDTALHPVESEPQGGREHVLAEAGPALPDELLEEEKFGRR